MARRILAWVSLIGFFLLVLNLLMFHIQPTLSAAIYILIVVVFMITSTGKGKESKLDSVSMYNGKDVINFALLSVNLEKILTQKDNTLSTRADISISSLGKITRELELSNLVMIIEKAKFVTNEKGIIVLVLPWKLEEIESFVEPLKSHITLEQKIFLVIANGNTESTPLWAKIFKDINIAVNSALEVMGKEASIVVIPDGINIIPKILD